MLTQEEFLHLLQEHEGRLYRIALAITGRDADAWDALQDAVESAVRSLPELQGGAQAFPGWMRRIVVNGRSTWCGCATGSCRWTRRRRRSPTRCRHPRRPSSPGRSGGSWRNWTRASGR